MAVLTENQYRQPVYGQTATTAPTGLSTVGLVGAGRSGLLVLLLGAWGALVPFVGPIFGFSADGTASWTWTSAHAWLFVLPGAVAVFGALLLMAGAGRPSARLGALLALAAAAWFVAGPLAWPVLQGTHFFSGYGTLREFEYWIGYSMGPGFLIGSLAGYALGRPSVPVAVEPAAAGPVVA